MSFWSWSKTPASNATADPTINWAEGMAPSAVNDSARAMAARLAEWRDDISGALASTGTANNYVITSNQVFDTLAHMNGAMIAFVANATNTGNSSINVDGLGSKSVRSAPGIELPAGTLILGTPYVAVYNNSDAAFYLRGYAMTPYLVPLGGLMPYLGSSAPSSNFVLPFGQEISRTTYATLFSLVSTTFGVGNGSTTFNVPDLRGRAIFGLDNMGGSAASRVTAAGGNFDGTALGTAGGAQNRTLTTAQLPVALGSATTTMSSGANSIPLGSAGNVTVGTTGNPTDVVASASAFAAMSATTTITNALGGNAHPTLPPAMVLPYILRVL